MDRRTFNKLAGFGAIGALNPVREVQPASTPESAANIPPPQDGSAENAKFSSGHRVWAGWIRRWRSLTVTWQLNRRISEKWRKSGT